MLLISSLALLSGCSIDFGNNQEISQQIALLQEQISGLNTQIQELNNKNDEPTKKLSLNSGSTIETNNDDYFKCGRITEFKNYDWFSKLDSELYKKFKMSDILNKGDACLSKDENFFIFIPDFAEFGCQYVFRYLPKTNELANPKQPEPRRVETTICVSKLIKVVGDYIETEGGQASEGNPQGYTYYGKYYFKTNQIIRQ